MTHDLLLEIGLEEIPARFVAASQKQLEKRVADFLDENRIGYSQVQGYSTPRRLTVSVSELATKQESMDEEVRGPALRIAQDESGEWTKAAQGFARGQGASTDDIFLVEEKGEEYTYIKKHTEGQASFDVLQGLDQVITSMTFPVTMRWARYNFEYIRPIHWIACLLDNQVVPFQVLDVESGRSLDGHRFLGKEIQLDQASDYLDKLEGQYVIADREKRQQIIMDQIAEIEKDQGFVVDKDQELLEEVTDLVEYPTAFFGRIDEDYLSLPEEILTTSMKDHQRYFAIFDKDGQLAPYFVSVRNGNQDHLENVVRGNEKVLTARLSDALFFWEEDRKISLADYQDKLSQVSFYQGLGSMTDKTKRIQVIADLVGRKVGLSNQELENLDRAADLSKFDLSTLMVNEFSELQGVMGGYYASAAGENDAVAQAIAEQYQPTSSEGDLPESDIGAVLAIADKLDNVLMFFVAGRIPTGSNDPFALRRQAYGVLRILLDKDWNLDMRMLTEEILEVIPYPNQETEENAHAILDDAFKFIKDRIRQLLEHKGVNYDIIEANLHSLQDNMKNIVNNANVLMNAKGQDRYGEVMESLSRVVNLRGKALDLVPEGYQVDVDLIQTESEKELFDQVFAASQNLSDQLSSNDYYRMLSDLQPAIDQFFEDNMVMAEDEEVRSNRLFIIQLLSSMILNFADVRELKWKS